MITFKKLLHFFFKGAYGIGYRYVDEDTQFQKNIPFQVINPTLHRWYADPFPFHDKGRDYIFVEIMDDKNGEKGTIGVCDLTQNNEFIEIINEPFHMSFPNVIKYNDNYYMMPETSEANELRLYKATYFPYKWEYHATLVQNLKIVDTVFFQQNDVIYAIGQKLPEKKNIVFRINLDKCIAKQIKLSGSYVDKRPAGNFINYSDGIYHALQECGRVYGEYLHMCKVDLFDDGLLDETEICTYKVSDMKLDTSIKYRRVHTFNKYTGLEVIDLLYYQFNPTIILEKFKRK